MSLSSFLHDGTREFYFRVYLKSHSEDGEALTHNEVRKCAAFLHWTAVRQPHCTVREIQIVANIKDDIVNIMLINVDWLSREGGPQR